MGRFVTGTNNDFNCKFGFARQTSNFGEVLENIQIEECEYGEPFHITRYVSEVGEYVDLIVCDVEGTVETLYTYDEDKLHSKMGLVGANATDTASMLQFFADWLHENPMEYPTFHVEY